MQTESEVKANGGAVVMDSGENLYPFDAPTVNVDIPRGKDIVTVTFRKPDLEDYLSLEKATQLTSRVVDGAIIDETQRHKAQSDFFDNLVTGASRRAKDAIEPSKEYEADDCKSFPFEFKDDCVARMNTSNFEVEAEGDDLLDQSGTMLVRQIVGDASAPSYTILYTMKPLPPAARQDYQKAIQVKRRIKNNDPKLETEVHIIKKAMKLFAPNFESLEGGRLEGGPFTAERKKDFIDQIDPMFQVGVIDACSSYYSKGSD